MKSWKLFKSEVSSSRGANRGGLKIESRGECARLLSHFGDKGKVVEGGLVESFLLSLSPFEGASFNYRCHKFAAPSFLCLGTECHTDGEMRWIEFQR